MRYLIIFLITFSLHGQQTVAYDMISLDQGWANKKADIVAQSLSGNDAQQHYHLTRWLFGLIIAWQVTGDITYFNEVKALIDNMESTAVVLSGGENAGYLGWPSAPSYGITREQDGTNLWEVYPYRPITYLLTILKDSPTFVAAQGLGSWYDNRIDFIKINIWEKWYQNNVNAHIYRNRTHLSTHWAVIAEHLDYLTSSEIAAYATVRDNILSGDMPNFASDPDNIQEILTSNLGGGHDGVITNGWSMTFGEDGYTEQDGDHGEDFIANAFMLHERGAYFTLTEMQAFADNLQSMIVNIGNYEIYDSTAATGPTIEIDVRAHMYPVLGAYDTVLLADLENNLYANDTGHPYGAFLAYGRYKYVDLGTLFYPEASGTTPPRWRGS